jgi:beta-phosphoglucomutase-like phosphatase (HAD superfamily)
VTRVLLCDADGCLFPSEEPAFEASADVTNRLLAELGVDRRFEPDELRAFAVGKNFRATAVELATAHGVALDTALLDRWVEEERRAVVAHLASVLKPDAAVREPLARMADRFVLTVVSSSALSRLGPCFTATGLDDLFPAERRFSAEDSLPVPTSKPDPAVYVHAGEQLGVTAADAVAIEDSVTGARSAVAAGFPTIGNVQFVPPDELDERVEALRAAGVAEIVGSWGELETLLARGAAV